MALFKLDTNGENLSNSKLVETSRVQIDFEKHLEGWLEKSPWAVTGEPIIWIGRQSTASLDDATLFPDLIGVDINGNIVIKDYIFSPKDITHIILKKYPTFNKSTVGCQIISDCVGHTSRHHYPGGEDRYSWISKGQYRLYDKN